MKLYAVILTTEDFIDTVLFDNEKEAIDSFDCIDYNGGDDTSDIFSCSSRARWIRSEFWIWITRRFLWWKHY